LNALPSQTSHVDKSSYFQLLNKKDDITEIEDSEQAEAVLDTTWTSQQVKLSIPALLSLLADPLLSLVDTGFVGRLGTTALASLGACTSVFHLAFNTFRATTQATTSLVGPYYSGNETSAQSIDPHDTELEAITRLSLQLGGALGLGVGLVLLFAGTPILKVMGIPHTSALYPDAIAYLSTRAWAAPCVGMIAVMTGLFRGAGTTVFPLIASIFASVLNLVLDPILMFGKHAWGVRGAAAATALSQLGAVIVLTVSLFRQGLVGFQRRVSLSPKMRAQVLATIFRANFSMIAKQGSLLGAWAYCTARATRLGPAHVAAHQVALSVWLVVALALDSNAIGAQILASRHFSPTIVKQSKSFFSLLRYQAKLAVGQGVLASIIIATVLTPLVPMAMGTDSLVKYHLQQLMPALALQQVLVSCCLVTEALAAATQQFTFLATGTILATALSVWQLSTPTTVTGLWNKGIVSLFLGRFVTALLAIKRAV
jgi:MATE family multidrug resistance protein